MVRERTETGQASAPDTIPHECCFVQALSEWLIMIPGTCESIEDARGESLAVHPRAVENLEEMR
jgi:hypothetical protein